MDGKTEATGHRARVSVRPSDTALTRPRASMAEPVRSTHLESIRAEFEQRGIKRVKVGGFDVDGILRGKYLSLDKFWGAVEGGFGFCDVIFGWDIDDKLLDNTTVTGWHTAYPDTHAQIDL